MLPKSRNVRILDFKTSENGVPIAKKGQRKLGLFARKRNPQFEAENPESWRKKIVTALNTLNLRANRAHSVSVQAAPVK